MTSQKFTTVRQSVFFKTTPLELYHAILDPEKREEWTGQRARGVGKIGNSFHDD